MLEEFFAQGDRERAAGLPVSPMMDRTSTSHALSQINFIEFIVAPLFSQAWGSARTSAVLLCLSGQSRKSLNVAPHNSPDILRRPCAQVVVHAKKSVTQMHSLCKTARLERELPDRNGNHFAETRP